METTVCVCTDDCALGFNPNCECTCEECDCRKLSNLVGEERARVFDHICEFIDCNYEMEKGWKRQKVKTRKWNYEYKYFRSKKTLCAFYTAENCLGFMVILGQKERDMFEENRSIFSAGVAELYDASKTYHDGKWLMLELDDLSLAEDIKRLLLIKRKPNKKET